MKKADHVHRGIAKAIDFILAGIFSALGFAGILGGALYLAIADGFSGQSLGKRIIGLKVEVIEPSPPRLCSYRDSIFRNVMYSIILVLVHIPLIGLVFFGALGLVVIGAETYFVVFDEKGARIGDILAGTHVSDEKSKFL